jgi:hypothetical protein
VTLAFNHLDDFSVVESWSGYFKPTNPAGTSVLPHTPDQSAHSLIATLRADQQRRPTFFAFYVGSGDTRFRAENVAARPRAAHSAVHHASYLSGSTRVFGLAGTRPGVARGSPSSTWPSRPDEAARITAAVAAGALILAAAAHGAQPAEPPGFHRIESGPDGGNRHPGDGSPTRSSHDSSARQSCTCRRDTTRFVGIPCSTCSRGSRGRPISSWTGSTYPATRTLGSRPGSCPRSSP